MFQSVMIIVFTLVYAFSIAYLVTTKNVKKSNDFGDSKGKYEDFTYGGLDLLDKKDNVKGTMDLNIVYPKKHSI